MTDSIKKHEYVSGCIGCDRLRGLTGTILYCQCEGYTLGLSIERIDLQRFIPYCPAVSEMVKNKAA